MARTRQMLLSLLAVVGLLSALGWTGEAAGCPLEPSMTKSMVHHPHHAPASPMSHDAQACPACLAVLAGPARLEAQAPQPFTPFVCRLGPLSGIDPSLDPPPPRGV